LLHHSDIQYIAYVTHITYTWLAACTAFCRNYFAQADSIPNPAVVGLSLQAVGNTDYRCTDKALVDYQSAGNQHLTISRLLINTKKTYFAILFKLFI